MPPIYHSKDITGPYVSNARNPVLTHCHLSYDYPISGVGHADLVELEDGRWYAVALGWRLVDGKYGVLGRETSLVPVTWEQEPCAWKEERLAWPVFSPATGSLHLQLLPASIGERVQLRVTADYLDLDFYYSADGDDWPTPGARSATAKSASKGPLAMEPILLIASRTVGAPRIHCASSRSPRWLRRRASSAWSRWTTWPPMR